MNNNIKNLLMIEAKKSYELDEVPIGAIVVKNNQIVGKGHNCKITDNDISSHAEINALKDASNFLGDWRLDGCDLYVTLEPCLMCYSAIKQSRINNVYYFVKSNKNKEFVYTKYIKEDNDFIYIENEDAKKILMEFFKERRKDKSGKNC